MTKSSAVSAVWRLAWIALLMSIASVGQTQPDPPQTLPSTVLSSVGHTEPNPPKPSPIPLLSPAWSNSYSLGTPPPEQWRRATPAFSYDGSCIAIAGGSEAQVISRTGRTLWKWKFGAINRFVVAGSVAVSPACDAIAMGGDSSYKYVWIAEENGHKISIPFPSTPLGVAFSRDGTSVAVGTGGERLYLFSRDGKEQWTTRPYRLGLSSDITFSPDGKFILVDNGGAILRANGSIVADFRADYASITADLQTIVTSWEPPHGPGPGNVSVWDQAGKQLFSNFSDDPRGVITPAGDKIMARVNEDQDVPPNGPYEGGETILQLFARDGIPIKEFPELEGRPVAISPDGKTVLLETGRSLDAIDLSGKRHYSIAVSPNMYKIAPDFSALVIFSWGSDATLEYFKLK